MTKHNMATGYSSIRMCMFVCIQIYAEYDTRKTYNFFDISLASYEPVCRLQCKWFEWPCVLSVLLYCDYTGMTVWCSQTGFAGLRDWTIHLLSLPLEWIIMGLEMDSH